MSSKLSENKIQSLIGCATELQSNHGMMGSSCGHFDMVYTCPPNKKIVMPMQLARHNLQDSYAIIMTTVTFERESFYAV